MPTIEEILDAEAVLRAARVTVDQLEPGDRVVIHRPPPGEMVCTISATGTVVSSTNTTEGRIHPEPSYRVEILPDVLVDGAGSLVFNCSAKFSVLRATRRATVEGIAAGLVALGYHAVVEGLGGNIRGVVVTTGAGERWTIAGETWLITEDDFWYITREVDVENGPAGTAEVDTSVELLVAWADQLMGCDR